MNIKREDIAVGATVLTMVGLTAAAVIFGVKQQKKVNEYKCSRIGDRLFETEIGAATICNNAFSVENRAEAKAILDEFYSKIRTANTCSAFDLALSTYNSVLEQFTTGTDETKNSWLSYYVARRRERREAERCRAEREAERERMRMMTESLKALKSDVNVTVNGGTYDV